MSGVGSFGLHPRGPSEQIDIRQGRSTKLPLFACVPLPQQRAVLHLFPCGTAFTASHTHTQKVIFRRQDAGSRWHLLSVTLATIVYCLGCFCAQCAALVHSSCTRPVGFASPISGRCAQPSLDHDVATDRGGAFGIA